MAEETRWNSWLYNVMDKFKGESRDAILAVLDASRHPFAAIMENWQGDFNIGTMIRNANAFNAKEVFYIGKKKYDPRGCVGTKNYIDITHLPDFDSLKALKGKYVFVCLDNVPGSVPMETFVWPENALMIFGEEGVGLTEEMLSLADHIVSIAQWGSVRSLNAGSSSAVAMYDYTKKYHENIS